MANTMARKPMYDETLVLDYNIVDGANNLHFDDINNMYKFMDRLECHTPDAFAHRLHCSYTEGDIMYFVHITIYCKDYLYTFYNVKADSCPHPKTFLNK